MAETNQFVVETATITLPGGNPIEVPVVHDTTSGTYFLRASNKDIADPEKKGPFKGKFKIENTNAREFHIATAISNVDGENGRLSYRGYDINALVEKTSYEETAYLLLMGDLPNAEQLADFKSKLAKAALIDPDVQDQMKNALEAVRVDKDTNPMALMSTLVAIMDANEPLSVKTQEDRFNSTLRTMAVMPTLIGLVNTKLQGFTTDTYEFATAEDFGPDGKDFSLARLTLSSLSGIPMQDLEPKKVAALEKDLILHAEHGNNLSSFTARVVDSGESKEGGWRVTLGAMQSLAGNRHGNASNEALDNLRYIQGLPGKTAAEKVDAYMGPIEEALREKAAGGKPDPERYTVPGIGHKIYKAPDPRAGALLKILNEEKAGLGDSELLEVAEALQAKLKDHPEFGKKAKKPLFPNVDFAAGVLLTQYLDIDPRLMTSMFAVARDVGWHAHAAEHARDAKNIVRPEAIPLTPDRDFVEMADRTPPTEVTAASGKLVFPGANKFQALAA